MFEAKDLGHLLIPEAECVRNDVELNATHRFYLVSSNMAGKSTLLARSD